MALSSIPVPPDAARDFRAKALVSKVSSWPRYTLKQPHGAFPAGTVFRRAVGSNGERYLVNAVVCECPDYERGYVCKHVRAIVMFEAQQSGSASEADPTPTIREVRGRFERLFPACPCGDLADRDGLCFVCASDREREQSQAAKRAANAGGR